MTPALPQQRARRAGLQPETAIQIGIMNFLRRMMELEDCRRFMAFHVPNGGQRNREEAKILNAMGVMAGIADIVLLVQYRAIFIELKHQPMRVAKQGARKGAIVRSAANGQEEAQKAFQRRAACLGFDYRVVAATDASDGLNQVLAILAEHNIRFKMA